MALELIALVHRAMISDANAQRKYEDSKALGQALEEIRAEIAKETERAAF